MELRYEGSVCKTIEILSPADFYPVVAQEIVYAESGKSLVVKASTDDGQVTYRVGIRAGTQTIFEIGNTMPDLYLSALKPAYLTCVEPAVVEYLRHLQSHPSEYSEKSFATEISARCKNSYKQYKLVPCGDKLMAYYGRMAVQKGEAFGERAVKYPISAYWPKYFEKIGKGYVDRTKLYMPETDHGNCAPDVSQDAFSKKTEKRVDLSASCRLFLHLKGLAKKAVRAANVKVPVNPLIINEAKRKLEEMREASKVGDVISFDLALLDIISILQRPIRTGDGSGVNNLLATSPRDFGRIIQREDDLLHALEGSIAGDFNKRTYHESFDSLGIEVYDANDEQKASVMKHLSPSLKSKVKAVYRVIPVGQREKFNTYVEKHDIRTIKMLWHGSRNENWMSIVQNSLVLNPDAIITGKMFGQGIYFAPSSMKSWGYTSNGKWTGEDSHTSIMGLYAVAYGIPYNVTSWSSTKNYKETVKNNQCNCLHAHAGSALHADEIVLYSENAVLLNYIVEFES